MFDVRFSRRSFLRVGGLAGFGLGLPTLLRAESAAGKGPRSRAKSVILVYLGGGLSHHDSFDLKPDATPEVRGKYNPIASSVPGVHVGELLPHMARTMHKIALVRSQSHNNDHHETATNWVMSGRFGSAFGDYPAIGAVVAHETGFTGTLPPYVAVPRNPSFTWELGRAPRWTLRVVQGRRSDQPNYRVPDVVPADAVTAKGLERRVKLLDAVDGLAKKVHANDQVNTYDEFRQRALAMVLSGEARRAFAIDAEPERVRDRYGRTTFGLSCLWARRWIEGGAL